MERTPRPWLIEKRKGAQMSQQQLAHLVGVSRNYLSELERGKTPGVEVAKRIADVLTFDWTRFFDSEHREIQGDHSTETA